MGPAESLPDMAAHGTAPENRPRPAPGAWPRLVAIVLNWNGGEETLECLRSLRALLPSPSGQRPVVILADNGSEDDSVARALAEDPALVVLRFGSNLGFAAGNNRAMRHAFDTLGADWICLLNSDCVVSPDLCGMIFTGLAEAERRGGEVGAAGPCLLYRDRPETIWACGGRIGARLNVTQLSAHGRRVDQAGRRPGPHDVDYVPGACLFVSRAAAERAGLLDEDFFCYLEDADWAVRIRAAGLRTIVVPGARAWHALSSSTGGGYSAGRKYMTGVNSVHFLRKHGSLPGWIALFVFDLLLWPLAWLRATAAGSSAGAVAKLAGLLHGLRGGRVDAATAARFAARRSP